MPHHKSTTLRSTFARMAAAAATKSQSTGNSQTRAMAILTVAPPMAAQVRYPSDAYQAWGGWAVSKWCRWGYWSEDGTALTVTRIMEAK